MAIPVVPESKRRLVRQGAVWIGLERDVCRKPLVGIGSAGWINRLLFNGSGLGSKYPKRITALLGTDVYLNKWNTQFRARGGRFLYEDYGAIVEAMRHFNHCTVGLYGEYSNEGGKNAGFKVVMMIPPYKRKRRTVNFRPASNFRLTYSMEGDAYANKMYTTDPEENEREGWFDRNALQWGSNTMKPDFSEKEGGRK